MGAVWGGGGGWGWGCRWGGDNDITINNNNNFNRNANIRAGNNNLSGRTNWQHRPEHRGGAPYRDRATANKYGGAARGDSLTQRQAAPASRCSVRAETSAAALLARPARVIAQEVSMHAPAVPATARQLVTAQRTGGAGDRAGSVGDRGSVSDRGSLAAAAAQIA